MSRHFVISSVAILILALAGVPGDAATRDGTHRSAHRAHAKHTYRVAARPPAPRDPWAEWAARWGAEVGNCPVGWYCYPNGNR